MPEYIRDHNTHPPLNHPGYDSTRLRHPRRRLTLLPHMLTEITSPVLGEDRLGEHDHDLTRQHGGEPQGQRNIVHGQVRDSDDRPVPYSLVEVRQANAAGRYRHVGDDCPAPLGPDFTWVGRTLTDDRGPTGSSRSAPASTPGRITVTPGGRPTSTSSCSAGPSLSASSPRCTFPTIRCSSRTPCGTRSPLPRHAPACPPLSTTTPPNPNGLWPAAGTSSCADGNRPLRVRGRGPGR